MCLPGKQGGPEAEECTSTRSTQGVLAAVFHGSSVNESKAKYDGSRHIPRQARERMGSEDGANS